MDSLAYSRAIEYARTIGLEDASDLINSGIFSDDEIRELTPDLSGEWAGQMTGPDLFSAALSWANTDETDDAFDAAFNDVCDAYETSFLQAVADYNPNA